MTDKIAAMPNHRICLHPARQRFSASLFLWTLLSLIVFAGQPLRAQVVTYTTNTANFNNVIQNNDPGNFRYAGVFNVFGEFGNYANQNSGSALQVAAVSYRTFTVDGNNPAAAARNLRPGDRFVINAMVNGNPNGVIGISFKNNNTFTTVADYANGQVCRFELGTSGGWRIFYGGTFAENTAATPNNTNRTLQLDITSTNTFNATIAGVTYHNLSFINSGPIQSFCIYSITNAAANASNPDSRWNNCTLQGMGAINFAGTANATITGTIPDGSPANANTAQTNNCTFSGTNIITLNGSTGNTYSGTTSITSGTVRLGAANGISNNAISISNNATFSTGAGAGFSETLGVLTMTNSATLALGTGTHTLSFANSSGAVWSGTLTISGWDVAGAGQVFFGNSAAGLTAGQLAQINFTGFGNGAKILATGEIQPANFYISAQNGNYNTGATWLGGVVPPAGAAVYINNGHTVTLDVDATVSGFTVAASATFNATNGSPRTLTLSSNTASALNVNGTWSSNGSTSTVVFTAPGPGPLSVTHAVNGTLVFDDVNIGRTGAGTHTIGVTFSNTSTVNGNLTLNTGGFVDTSPPNYGTSSALIYNTGNLFNHAAEWRPGVTSGVGYPNDVIFGSSLINSGLSVAGVNLFMRGNLIFAVAGSNLTLANSGLNIGKSWINNGTTANFTSASSTVTFTGAGVESIGGTNTNPGGYAFNDLRINKTAPGSVTLNRQITLGNLSVDGSGTFTLNGFSLTVTSIAGTIAGAVINNNTASGITLTITNGNSNNFAGSIQNGSTGTISIFKSGAGTQGFSGANTYTGTTTVTAGTLSIGGTGASGGNGLSAGSNYTFSGGNLSFDNMPNGSSVTGGTINIQANTSITLNGPNAYTVNFAPSNGVAWNAASTVTVFNWTPSAGRIIQVGAATGLTGPSPAGQLGRINFDNYGVGAKIVGIEVKPAFLYVTQATGSGNYTTAASWLLGDRPVLNDGTESIYIQPGFTLNMDIAAPTVRVLRCEVAGNVIMNAGDSVIIFPTGDFRIAGTVTMTSTSVINMSAGISLIAQSPTASFSPAGFLNFNGAFAITSNSPNAVFLPNVNLRDSVNFGLNSYIQNGSALYMYPGGYVSTNPPYYSIGSTLVYRTNNTYGRSLEWSATTGRGYPHHVLITNNTTLNMGAWSGTNTVRQCAGNLTIDAGSTFSMNEGTEDMNVQVSIRGNVNVNGTLRLSDNAGGDLAVGGNYTFSAAGSVFNNGRAVIFNGSLGDQFITRTGGGIVDFHYLVLNKPSGNLRMTLNTNGRIISSVNNNTGLRVLQLLSGDFDMNDGVFTLQGDNVNSMNVLVSGATRRIFTSTGTGEFRIRGSNSSGIAKFNVISQSSGLLLFDNNVEVSTTVGCNFGATGISTINAILRIDQYGYVILNSPDYGPASTLIYNNGAGGYKRNMEWNTNAGSVGYPHDVIVQNSTLVELNSTDYPANFALGCSGKLSIEAGSAVTTAAMAYTLSVGDSLNIRGTLTLSTNSAGDLFVGRSWNRSSTGVFNQNDRMVTFNGANAGSIRAAGGQTFSRMTIDKANSGAAFAIDSVVTITNELFLQRGTVTLNNEVIIQSNATRTARIGQTTTPANLTLVYNGIGKFQIQRYLPLNTNTAARRWRLLSAPVRSNNAPTINAAWQEGQVSTDRLNPSNNTPGFGTAITWGTTAANGFDQGITNNPSIQRFNAATNTWVGVPATNSGAITNEPGYMLFVRGDRSIVITGTNVNGTPTTLRVRGEINTGSVTIPLNASGLQVIGNPFASAISFNNVSYNGVNPGTTANRSFYLWDPKTAGASGVGKFITFTSTGSGTYTITGGDGNTSAYTNTGIIESGAAFVVPAAGGNFVIAENCKLSSNSTVGLASRPLIQPVPRQPVQSLLCNLYILQNGEARFLEGVRMLARNDFSNELNADDAPKPVAMSSFDPLSLVRNNVKLSVEVRRTPRPGDTLHYRIGTLPAGTYQFDFIAEQLQRSARPVLIDRFTASAQPLKITDTSRIQFTVTADPASTAPDRFLVVFGGRIPVKQFSAEIDERRDVKLLFTAPDEEGVEQYELERSADTTGAPTVLQRFTATGNAAMPGYSFTDVNPGAGTWFYRLKTIQPGSELRYSDWKKITIRDTRNSISVFPNPVTGTAVRLQVHHHPAASLQYRLYTPAGQQILTGLLAHPGGSSIHSIRFRQTLPAGLYMLEVSSAGNPAERIPLTVQ